MKNMKFLLILSFMALNVASRAADSPSDILLSLVGMKPNETTEAQITTLLGKPDRTEEGKNKSIWYYTMANNDLVMYWDNRDLTLQKYFFSTTPVKKDLWDGHLMRSLRMGQTDLAQAIKALGTPKEMMVKEMNQELHYTYQHTVLNLFFRKGTLVNTVCLSR